MNETQWISPEEARRVLGLGVQSFAHLLSAGRFSRLVMPSGRVKVKLSEVREFATQQADWWPTDRAAAEAGVSRQTIHRWKDSGLVQSQRIGRKVYVYAPDLRRGRMDQETT